MPRLFVFVLRQLTNKHEALFAVIRTQGYDFVAFGNGNIAVECGVLFQPREIIHKLCVVRKVGLDCPFNIIGSCSGIEQNCVGLVGCAYRH